MTTIKVAAIKFTSAGEATGKPCRVMIYLPEGVADMFPKSARVQWNQININFGLLNATTGDKNEASIKRYRSVMKLIDRNGWDIEWSAGQPYEMTREELEAAL